MLTEFAEYDKELELFKTVGETIIFTSEGFVVEGKDMVFMAMSDDKRWIFMVDVSVDANYDQSGEIQDVDWVGSLEIDQADQEKIEI